MQEEKKSNIFGIPFVVVMFVLVATLPALAADGALAFQIHRVRTAIKNQKVEVQVVYPTASASATPTVLPTATPSAKALFKVPTPIKSLK